MAKQDTHHVVPNPAGGWDVKRGGGDRASHHQESSLLGFNNKLETIKMNKKCYLEKEK